MNAAFLSPPFEFFRFLQLYVAIPEICRSSILHAAIHLHLRTGTSHVLPVIIEKSNSPPASWPLRKKKSKHALFPTSPDSLLLFPSTPVQKHHPKHRRSKSNTVYDQHRVLSAFATRGLGCSFHAEFGCGVGSETCVWIGGMPRRIRIRGL